MLPKKKFPSLKEKLYGKVTAETSVAKVEDLPEQKPKKAGESKIKKIKK